jgi:hypothetical protein
MRTVTLYSAEQRLVRVYGGFIPYHVRQPIRAYNSPDIFEKDTISHVHHLPVERWVFDGREFFIALDPQLRDIVHSMITTSENAVRDICQVRINKLNDELKVLCSRTIWDMIKLKFKRKKK